MSAKVRTAQEAATARLIRPNILSRFSLDKICASSDSRKWPSSPYSLAVHPQQQTDTVGRQLPPEARSGRKLRQICRNIASMTQSNVSNINKISRLPVSRVRPPRRSHLAWQPDPAYPPPVLSEHPSRCLPHQTMQAPNFRQKEKAKHKSSLSEAKKYL